MKTIFPGYYRPTSDEFAQRFKDGVFVFDANVLLNLYRYTNDSRDAVINILRTLQERVWLPHQAAFEYQRQRVDELLNQIGLVDKIKSEIDKAIEAIDNLGRASQLFAVNKLVDPVQKTLKAIKDDLKSKKEKKPDLMNGDAIFNAITEIFDGAVGQPFAAEVYADIHKEGKKRYASEVPPGYKDKSAKPDDTDQFGDLVIWKQLIEHSKATSQPLIFVTDDAKEDWWRIVRGERLGPRPELIQEFFDATDGNWFYIYSTEQFLKNIRQHLEIDVPENVIEEAEGIEDFDSQRQKIDLTGCANLFSLVFGISQTRFFERYIELSDEQRTRLAQVIESVLKTLTYREREILKLRIGLGDGYIYTQNDCGRIFKITRNHVRQIQTKAIRKLQHPVRSRILEEFIT